MKNITNANIISTKKGDTGTSKNFSNQVLPKTDILFETLGGIDELSSSLGVAYHYVTYQKELQIIQRDLQNIMSIIATNVDDKHYQNLVKIDQNQIAYLEQLEQAILEKHPIKPVFVLPGSDSSKAGSYLDLSRSISRRIERTAYRFNDVYQRDDLKEVLQYLNRLSDVLYIMARSYDEKKS